MFEKSGDSAQHAGDDDGGGRQGVCVCEWVGGWVGGYVFVCVCVCVCVCVTANVVLGVMLSHPLYI